MKEGDSMTITVDNKTTGYERIVEGIVPQNFNEWGLFLKYFERKMTQKSKEIKSGIQYVLKILFFFP
jgi:hypothetical protein